MTGTAPRSSGNHPVRVSMATVGYLLAGAVLVALYPVLPGYRSMLFLTVSCAGIPAVLVGLSRLRGADRTPWRLLLLALVVLNASDFLGLAIAGLPRVVFDVTNTAGNMLIFAAIFAVVLRRGRRDIGGIIDTMIITVALGSMLWDFVLLPHVRETGAMGEPAATQFTIVLVLSGVLGALIRIVRTGGYRIAASWLLMSALVLALSGAVLLGRFEDEVSTAVSMMFMGAYVSVGGFGVAASSALLVRARPTDGDALSAGRLVFLGCALAVIPVVGGGRVLLDLRVDGLLLAGGGLAITVLVMMRIGVLARERTLAERALRHEASHDPLTGLANRRELIEQVNAELRRPRECAVVFCDLDDFKAVNDRYGHVVGDQLLVEIGRRLVACVRADDLVSRFGGDEFLVLFRDTPGDDVYGLCERIADALREPIAVGDVRLRIGASVGAVRAVGGRPGTAAATEDLIDRADQAMYSAKQTAPATPDVRIVTG